MKKFAKRILGNLGLLTLARETRLLRKGIVLIDKTDRDGCLCVIRVGFPIRIIRLSPRHAIYRCDMVTYFDYYFNAVRPKKHWVGLRIVDYSLPKQHVLKDSGIEFLFTSLPESDETTAIYLKYAQLLPGHVVFDLGAYCGASAYFFSKAVGPSGRVISYEPDPENHAALVANVRELDLHNVLIVQKGVWKHNGTIEFQVEGNMGSSISSIMGRTSNTQVVDTVTLHQAIIEACVDRVDFIKMDIEGAEVPVLNAAMEVLRRFKPRLVVEPHYVDGGILNTAAVCNSLTSIGYRTEILTQGACSHPLVFAQFKI